MKKTMKMLMIIMKLLKKKFYQKINACIAQMILQILMNVKIVNIKYVKNVF